MQDEGYLKQDPNGFFGRATLYAVKSFQNAEGFTASGYVGPITRQKIHEISCGSTTDTPAQVTSSTNATPTITDIQSAGNPVGTVDSNHKASIHGTGLSGNLVIKFGVQEVQAVYGTGISDGYAEFTVPARFQSAVVSITVTNSQGKTSTPYTVNINVPNDHQGSTVTIVSPNGGETLQKGQTYQIKWNTNNISGAQNMSVILMNRNRNEWSQVPSTYLDQSTNLSDPYTTSGINPDNRGFNASYVGLPDSTANNGVLSWTVPNSLPNGSSYYLEICEHRQVGQCGFSNSTFTISASSITPTPQPISVTYYYPQGTTWVTPGGPLYLTINHPQPNVTYNLALYKGNDLVSANVGSDMLTVAADVDKTTAIIPTNIQTGGTDYRIKVSQSGSPDVYSDYFRIAVLTQQPAQPMSINYSYPTGALYITAGNPLSVALSNILLSVPFKLSLYKGANVISGNVGSGSFDVAADLYKTTAYISSGVVDGTDYRIRVYQQGNEAYTNYFTVGTPQAKTTTPAPTLCGILPVNSRLTPGQSLASCNGVYQLIFQGDGNVVLYDTSASPWKVLWYSNTHGKSASQFVMQGDYNLVLYDANNAPLWYSNTHNLPTTIGLQILDNGTMQIADPSGKLNWLATLPPPPPTAAVISILNSMHKLLKNVTGSLSGSTKTAFDKLLVELNHAQGR